MRTTLFRPAMILFFAILVSVILVFSAQTAVAQQFKRLTPTSQYACIKFPSGKTGVGKAARDGYATRSFAVASKDISEKLSAQRKALASKQELLRDFMRDNEISQSDLSKIISGGFAIGLPDRIKQTTANKLIKLHGATNNTKAKISEIQAELKALDDCKKGKTDFNANLPAQGGATLGTNFGGSVALAVYVVIEDPETNSPLDTRLFYCAKGLTKSSSTGDRYVLRSARKDPCADSAFTAFSFSSCPTPAKKLYILMATQILAPGLASQEGIAAAIAAMDAEYGDTYSLKPISDNPNSPCGYLN